MIRGATLSGRMLQLGIQWRITACVALVLTALMAMIVYVSLRAEHQATDLVYSERLNTASMTAAMLDREFVSIALDAEAGFQQGGLSVDQILDRASDQSDESFFRPTGIWVLNADGQLLAGAGQPEYDSGLGLALISRSVAETTDPKLAVLPGLPDITTAEPRVVVGTHGLPGSLGLVIAIHMVGRNRRASFAPTALTTPQSDRDPTSLADREQQSYHLEIIGPDGITVMAMGSDETPGERSIHADAIPGGAVGAESFLHKPSRGDDFAPHVLAFAPLAHSSLYLTLEQPVDVALAGPNRLRLRLLVLTALGYVGVLGVAWFAAGRILKPTRQLKAAAGRISQGDLQSPISVRARDELGQLGRALERMRSSLLSAYEEVATRASGVQESAPDAIVVMDREGRITSFNGAAQNTFGYSAASAVGQAFEVLWPPSSRQRYRDALHSVSIGQGEMPLIRQQEWTARRADGSDFPVEITISRIGRGGETFQFAAYVRDITARKLVERNLETLATTDSLTGLVNRQQFGILLGQSTRSAERRHVTGALVSVNLDHFKYINDTYSYRTGDRLLEAVADRLRNSVRASDVIGRTGGDEFSVILQDMDEQNALRKSRQLVEVVGSVRVAADGDSIQVTASAGVAMFPVPESTPYDIVGFADIAMNRAKENGRGSVSVYHPAEQERETVSALQHARHLITDAMTNNRIILFYQPIVTIATRDVAFYEVLVRIRDRENSPHMPAEFIPAAEELDLIQPLDRSIAELAMADWRSRADTGVQLNLCVNVSGRTITPEFVDFITGRARHYRIPRGRIHLEVTETAAMRSGPGTRQCLVDLSEAGFPIGLDDFGSGLTSFRQLAELPLAMLKIDGALLRNAIGSTPDRDLLKALVGFAHALSLPVVGEQVENEKGLQMLGDMGVEYAQGYFLGRPAEFP